MVRSGFPISAKESFNSMVFKDIKHSLKKQAISGCSITTVEMTYQVLCGMSTTHPTTLDELEYRMWWVRPCHQTSVHELTIIPEVAYSEPLQPKSSGRLDTTTVANEDVRLLEYMWVFLFGGLQNFDHNSELFFLPSCCEQQQKMAYINYLSILLSPLFLMQNIVDNFSKTSFWAQPSHWFWGHIHGHHSGHLVLNVLIIYSFLQII